MTALVALDSLELAGVTAAPGAVNEDLMQKIWDVSRIPLPGLDRIGRGRVTARRFDWIRDRLAAAADNAYVDGAIYAQSASAPTDFAQSATAVSNRFINYVTNSLKAVSVGDVAEAESTPGGSGGMAYNLMVAQQELMRDIEFMIFGDDIASVAGTAQTAAPRSASYASILDTTAGPVANTTFFSAASANPWDAGGWTGSVWAIPTVNGGGAATLAGLSEADVRDCVQALYLNGTAAGPDQAVFAMTHPTVKRRISEYYYTSTAKAAPFIKTSGEGADQRAVGSIEFIVTDYGTIELEANRFMPTAIASGAGAPLWIFNPNEFELVWLKSPSVTVGPNLGLAELRWCSAFWGTRFHPEACAGVYNIDSTAAMTTS